MTRGHSGKFSGDSCGTSQEGPFHNRSYCFSHLLETWIRQGTRRTFLSLLSRTSEKMALSVAPCGSYPVLLALVDVSDVYIFFILGEGNWESEAPEGGGGIDFLSKIPEGGGSPGRRGRGAGRVSAANWGNLGGGLNIVFRGRNVHQEKCFLVQNIPVNANLQWEDRSDQDCDG